MYTRGSTAIIWRSFLHTLPPPAALADVGPAWTARLLSIGGCSIAIVGSYLVSSIGPRMENLQHLHGLAEFLASLGMSWLAVGGLEHDTAAAG